MKNEKAKNVLIIILLILVIGCVGYIVYPYLFANNKLDVSGKNNVSNVAETKNNPNTENKIVDEKQNKGEELNLVFLKLENNKENTIYSPLSIKYALKMLEEGATGNSKLQLSKLLGDSKPTTYKANKNMAFANSLFIRDTFKDSIKTEYINTLKHSYGAEVKFDSFKTTKTVNDWVSNNTLKLIPNFLNNIEASTNFMLINALGIDMEWQDNFLHGSKIFGHEHENLYWSYAECVASHSFDNKSQKISGMDIAASINNYNIVKELGEENIKETINKEYIKWAKGLSKDDWEHKDIFNGNLTDENIQKQFEKYFYGDGKDNIGYFKELDSNYKLTGNSTDFSLYVDDNVKVFAKDLKKYNETTLQYVGIMPISKSLDIYINETNETKISNLISNLKDIKSENFKDGVATLITGYIPKFDFKYNLRLKEDLQKLGIKDIFEEGKANLTGISDDKTIYINEAKHQANIEFTQDGIKAAAVSMIGGMRKR